MATVTVHIGEDTKILSAAKGETLHQVLTRHGFYHHAPCGGNGQCRKCKVKATGLAFPGKKETEWLTDEELLQNIRFCCLAQIDGNCHVYLDAQHENQRVTPFFEFAHDAKGHGLACGIDIGTTTVVLYLYSKETGKPLVMTSAQNRQSAFGDDVISRIAACQEEKVRRQLQEITVTQCNELMENVCSAYSFTPKDITSCVIAGNTTMLHLLTGLDPTPMGSVPFTPTSLFGTVYRGEQLGLQLSCDVYLTPCISAFVGGDVTAGMALCDMDITEKTVLLLDIGTNGEMALCKNGHITCLATAAGPAFEGAHIACGSGGVPGAIEKIDQTGYQTVEDFPATSICGSGLLDSVAMLLQMGALDETGFLEENYPLTPEGNVYLTPQDIREVQLAKSAICSGIIRLLEITNTTMDEVDQVYLAGGLGNYMNPQSAVAIGMIPTRLESKCLGMGNTAGGGAVRAALFNDFLDRIHILPKICSYYELSGDARFNELFAENMLFPESE